MRFVDPRFSVDLYREPYLALGLVWNMWLAAAEKGLVWELYLVRGTESSLLNNLSKPYFIVASRYLTVGVPQISF
ncbi:hypothetical protein QN277_015187 [Acacia crassicarpa]|uniref:Uncharacterized protein n=1 Tax=Acacia crassicarpa TaxID=499986 RepID=A0AAE1KLP3_9FABA|nr:hypothetical protein QN277_015187 [Acacia crassicarpa]